MRRFRLYALNKLVGLEGVRLTLLFFFFFNRALKWLECSMKINMVLLLGSSCKTCGNAPDDFSHRFRPIFEKSWSQIRGVFCSRAALCSRCHASPLRSKRTCLIASEIFYGAHYVVRSTTGREAPGSTKREASSWQSVEKEGKLRRLTLTSGIMSCYPSATLHLNVAVCNVSVLSTEAATLTLGHLQTQRSCWCVGCCFGNYRWC